MSCDYHNYLHMIWTIYLFQSIYSIVPTSEQSISREILHNIFFLITWLLGSSTVQHESSQWDHSRHLGHFKFPNSVHSLTVWCGLWHLGHNLILLLAISSILICDEDLCIIFMLWFEFPAVLAPAPSFLSPDDAPNLML